jgi:dephospho-CoA kinase
MVFPTFRRPWYKYTIMIIIGITGTLGAGKGTVVEYLASKGFAHYSARAFITREVERRGLPVSRDSMTVVADDLRAAHSPGYIIESLYAEAARAGKNAVIESIHNVREVAALREKGNFFLLAIDADPKLRYARISLRGSATDKVSFEKFLADEAREMHETDPHKQNIAQCMELADEKVLNNGTKEELHVRIDEIFAARRI